MGYAPHPSFNHPCVERCVTMANLRRCYRHSALHLDHADAPSKLRQNMEFWHSIVISFSLFIKHLPMKRIHLVMGAFAVGCIIGCGKHHHEHTEAAEEHEHHDDEITLSEEQLHTLTIQIDTVVPSTFHEVIKTGGLILPASGEESTVCAPAGGVVHLVRAMALGMPIRQGEHIITLRADHVQDGDPAKRARIAYERAKAEYERAVPLARQQIVSQTELEALRADYETARIGYEALATQSTTQGMAITAPQGGYLKSIEVGEGNYVSAGTPLLTLSSNRRLQLRADIPLRLAGMAARLSTAHFRPAGSATVFSLDSLDGRLLARGRNTAENLCLPITFEFSNTAQIVPGTPAEIWLTGTARNGVITLPIAAITEEQGRSFVYLQQHGHSFSRQEVGIGADDGTRVEITHGLKSGDRVVTQGAVYIRMAAASNTIPAHNHNH